MKLIITEEEKKEIIAKYSDNHNQEILNYLKRNFPVWSSEPNEWLKTPIKFVQVNGKSKSLNQNKSYLVNVISNIIKDEFPNESEQILRRTVKYYIDIIRIDS